MVSGFSNRFAEKYAMDAQSMPGQNYILSTLFDLCIKSLRPLRLKRFILLNLNPN